MFILMEGKYDDKQAKNVTFFLVTGSHLWLN